LGQPLEEGKSEATSFSFYLCAHMYVFQGVVMGGFACMLHPRGIRCYLCLSFVFKLFARFPLTNGFSLVAQPDERSHHKEPHTEIWVYTLRKMWRNRTFFNFGPGYNTDFD